MKQLKIEHSPPIYTRKLAFQLRDIVVLTNLMSILWEMQFQLEAHSLKSICVQYSPRSHKGQSLTFQASKFSSCIF